MGESFTTGQVARLSSVHVNVVKKWIADGLLHAYRLPAGHYRITRDAYLDFLRRYELPIPEELQQRGPARILIIDDDETQIALLEDFFSIKNYRVESATDGYEGLIKIGALQPDLVFLDISMPRMNGMEMLDTLQNSIEVPHPTIVVITGKRDQDLLDQLREKKFFKLIFKPYSLREIAALLDSLDIPQ